MRYYIVFVIFLLIFTTCSKKSNLSLVNDLEDDNQLDNSSLIENYDHPAIISMVRRAQQIANIEWTPLNNIPNRIGFYPKGISIKGIPYSSVKELDKFVGHEVSFHTFMTAVNNPYSVLYTECVNELPYHGVNCAAYYGTTCNMTVKYALGLKYPYITDQYQDLNCFYTIDQNLPEHVQEGDVLWSPGHVVLVIDIKKDKSENICKVTILESGGHTYIKSYTFDEFSNRWNNDKWVIYRYKYLYDYVDYQKSPFVDTEGEFSVPYTYNNNICVSRGDKACYREDEPVVINILNDGYDSLLVYRDNNLYSIMPVNDTNAVVMENLPFGMYSVRLVSDNDFSEYTYFEVINTSVLLTNMGSETIVEFESQNAYPLYVKLCTITGGQLLLYELDDNDCNIGRKIVRSPKTNEYVKVYFKGRYGIVSKCVNNSNL